MNLRSWTALACLLVSACDDGAIGEEGCIGSGCKASRLFSRQRLMLSFQPVTTVDPSQLDATWQIAVTCVDRCDQPAQVFPSRTAGVWTPVRGAPVPTVQMIALDGSRETVSLPAPDGATMLSQVYYQSTRDLSLLAHAQWTVNGEPGVDEIAMVGEQSDEFTRTVLEPHPLTAWPTGAILSYQGFLMFEPTVSAGTPVRSVAMNGQIYWQKTSFTGIVVGGSAVALTNSFVVGATDNSLQNWGMLWLGIDGTPARFTSALDSSWRNISMLFHGSDNFTIAAQSELIAVGASNGPNDGNIDIVRFNGQNPFVAFRMMKECLYDLSLNGLTVDSEGTIYVSSIVGTREEPRGLLCRMPLDGTTPRCFQTAPQVNEGRTLGAIVAVQPDVIIGILGETIARFDLPH